MNADYQSSVAYFAMTEKFCVVLITATAGNHKATPQAVTICHASNYPQFQVVQYD
jgi:hypothetical protein